MLKHFFRFSSQNVLKTALNKQNNVYNRAIFILHQNMPESRLRSPKLLNASPPIQSYREKSKKSQKEQIESEPDSEDKDDFSDGIQDKNTKIININVTSLRVDAILKSALGIARNKIETLFYESKIRINGEKILKKSVAVQQGDEVDLIKGPDIKNPDFINVARVEILSIKANEENITVKVRRWKSLTVEAY